jgi:hypothetical protein
MTIGRKNATQVNFRYIIINQVSSRKPPNKNECVHAQPPTIHNESIPSTAVMLVAALAELARLPDTLPDSLIF